MEDWAYFIEKLKSVKEGDGSLLDHTMLVWGSSDSFQGGEADGIVKEIV